jgi:uncharacterized DUF497 family protein
VGALRFEWDEAKNLSNRRKHGVNFEQACAVFLDPWYVSVQNRIVDGELRWLTLGFVEHVILLAVAHTVCEDNDDEAHEVIRIISARQATRRERRR